MRDEFVEALIEIALEDERICLLVSDPSPADKVLSFREACRERYFDVGISEQAMIGIAAGMAKRGLRPFAYGMAPFVTFRPFEMIRMDLGFNQLPVTVVGSGAGLNYGMLGSSHHAVEDVALMSTVPGMTIWSPADPEEVAMATAFCAKEAQGPAYIRLSHLSRDQRIPADAEPSSAKGVRQLTSGGDACILASGSMVSIALSAAEQLTEEGNQVGVYSAAVINPLDEDAIAELLKQYPLVVGISETSPSWSLGGHVERVAYRTRATADVLTICLKGTPVRTYGTWEDLLAENGISADTVAAAVRSRLTERQA